MYMVFAILLLLLILSCIFILNTRYNLFPHFRKDIDKIEKVQKGVTKLIPYLGNKTLIGSQI